MALSAATIQSLLNRLARTDPPTHAILELMLEGLKDVYSEVFPSTISVPGSAATGGLSGLLIAPTDFAYTILSAIGVKFTWTQPTTASVQYEIRKGTDWTTAEFITRTPSTQVIVDPLTTGNHTFLIKSLDSNGNYSTDTADILVSVVKPGTPIITPQVINNNVLLRWTTPSSTFDIAYYEIYREGALFGRSSSTFAVIVESVTGDYTYNIIAYDIAGNQGSIGGIGVHVVQADNFQLLATQAAHYNGTLVNAAIYANVILACINLTETYQQHFDNHAWASPQAQVNATYPIYIQPSMANGSYEEVVDFGVIINDVIASVNYTTRNISGTPLGGNTEMIVLVKLATSTDGINFTPFQNGSNIFSAAVRYLKVRFEFTALDDKSLIELFNIIFNISVHEETDSGSATADEDDVDGTVVLFNKAFKDIIAIQVTPVSIEARFPVVNFTDAPNPTSFKVLMYDAAGVRVTCPFSWTARGVL